MKSKLIKGIITCLILVGVCVGGYYGYDKYSNTKTVVAATQYYSSSVKKMNLEESIQGTGAAYVATTKDVVTNNNGTLSGLTVKVGDTVTAGQTLFTSDSDDLRKAVTTAKNNLAKQNLTLTSDQSAEKVDDNKVAMDQISVSDATTQLNDAYKQLKKMTVTAPIGGLVTAVNSSNGDSLQSGKAVLTIVDMNSIKIKVSVDELDISKVVIGQKATITFDAISGQTYEGAVESVGQTGNVSNNVTTYDVVVSVTKPTGIKLGMNAKVTIKVQSKENALVIPAEALVEVNGQKFVKVDATSSTASTTSSAPAGNTASTTSSTKNTQAGNSNSANTQSTKLVSIKTGLETQNYIEVTEGLTEGEKVLVQLPKASTTTTTNRNNMGGADMGGFGGQMPQGGPPSGGTNSSQKN